MSVSKYIVKAQQAVEKSSEINQNIAQLKEANKSNISKLKTLKDYFSAKFNELVNIIENIPEENVVSKAEEVSPASIVSIIHWDWLYNLESTKQFERNTEDHYITRNNSSSGTINAYSSHVANENFQWKVKFHDTNSFGCGGFGLISKNDPNFEKSYGNFTGHPLACLCCSGSWSAASMTLKNSEALQHKLKRSVEKILIFELNMDEQLYKVYDPEGELFAEYNLSSMSGKDDYVLFYYSSSNTNHSHEIIPS